MPESTSIQIQRQIALLNAGDPKARESLLGIASERLRQLTHRMFRDFKRLRPYVDTDDVFQSALLRLWRALESVPLNDSKEFARLAASQIRRELIDQVRHYFGVEGSAAHRADAPPPQDSSPGFEPPAGSVDPTRLLAWQEFHEHVEKLPTEDRMLVDLLWYHGWTHQEAADLLQYSLSTLRRRWLELRMRLIPFLPGELGEM